MESAIVGDKGSTTLGKNGNTKLENNYLCRCQDYSMIDGLYDNTRIAKGGTPLPHTLPRVRKHERIIHHHIINNNGSVSCYFYDAAGERTVKLTSESEMVHVNGKKVGGNANICKFTAYVSPYFVVSNGGAYTKHIYAASQRIASKLGNEDGFGADPRRVEMAGGKKISDFQKGNVGERFKALGYEYSAPEKEKVEKDSTMDSEEPENLVFFYHPDHLGSTSYVTDADGNIAQHVEYIPYGEIFVEERNSQFSTNFLFNAKELDNETGLYYYGARYLDPTGAMWLSVDPMWEKYAGMTPYNYCMGNPVKLVDPDGRDVFYDENGTFLRSDEKEFRGNVYVTKCDNATSQNVPLQDADISAKAYSNIYTDILKQRGYDTDKLYNGKISVSCGIFSNEGHLNLNLSYNDPADPNKFPFVVTNFPLDGKGPFKISINQRHQNTHDLLGTVDNIVNAIGVHEYNGHGIKHYGDRNKNHYLVYRMQMKDSSWNGTTDDFKQSMILRYSKYLEKEMPNQYYKEYESITKNFYKYGFRFYKHK